MSPIDTPTTVDDLPEESWSDIVKRNLATGIHYTFPFPITTAVEAAEVYQPFFKFYGVGRLGGQEVLYAEVMETFEDSQGLIRDLMLEAMPLDQRQVTDLLDQPKLFVAVTLDAKQIIPIDPPGDAQ